MSGEAVYGVVRFDHYRYELGDHAWGPVGSPVTIRVRHAGGRPPLDAPLNIAARAGCDPQPVDPTTEEGRLTLTSYVWGDQRERLERLRAALDVAAATEAPVERAGAADGSGRAWRSRRRTWPRWSSTRS